MIRPTVGRVVLFSPSPTDNLFRYDKQLCTALITYVHSDTRVNLVVFDHYGVPCPRTGVHLIQDGDPVPEHGHCEWMPFQKGQAAKTEALEAELKRGKNR